MPQDEKSEATVTRADRPSDGRINDERYDAQRVETKWFERWQQDASLYAAEPDSTKKKYYVLEMLPYPSGALAHGPRAQLLDRRRARPLHVDERLQRASSHGLGFVRLAGGECGHLRTTRRRASGRSRNIANMKAQMKRLGFAYDWSREVTTCLPDYYRWNQWFFLKLFEQGLAYRKKSKVNWCPKCATVLANEQVVNGCCWRHEDTLVEQRELEQWFVRTTKYADELLRDLDKLEGWPEKVRTMQRNWIGRSEGTLVDFKLDGNVGPPARRSVSSPRASTRSSARPRCSLRRSIRSSPTSRATTSRLGAQVQQLIARAAQSERSR